MVRLKSELWVKAYIRRCAGAGSPAVVVRRGDTDSGAIYIRIARLDGSADVYGPAPSDDDGERRFMALLQHMPAPDATCDEYLDRQHRIDSDMWLIEVEDRAGRHFLEEWGVGATR